MTCATPTVRTAPQRRRFLRPRSCTCASASHPANKPRGFGPETSQTQAPLQVCPEGAAVVEAVLRAGGWVSPAVTIARSAHGRSVHVTSRVAAGEPLAYVPLSVCVTSRQPAGRGEAEQASADLARLLLTPGALLDEHRAVLPSPGDVAVPLVWPNDAVAALGRPWLEEVVAAERQEAVGQAGEVSVSTWLWARAMVDSRAYRRWDGYLSVEPLVDLVNHAPFGGGDGATPHPRRNTLHSYVQPGAHADATRRLRHFPPGLASGGAAVLVAIRPLAAQEEVLVSYRDATPGGGLTADDSLLRYGFVPAPTAHLAWRCHQVPAADVIGAQKSLAAHVDAAAAAGTPKEALLQAALALHGRQVAAEACQLLTQASRHDAGSPMRLALDYRCGRVLALGRAALSRLPPSEVAGAGLEAGIGAACDDAGLAAQLLAALTARAPALLTMEEDLAQR
jgi:hypothetical protein